MTTQYTPKQALPFPDDNEKLKDVPDFIAALANAVDPKLVQVHASSAALGTAVPSPTDGMVAYLNDSDTLLLRRNGAWVQLYPPTPTIYNGAGAPSNSLGSIGDVYIQTS